MKNVYEILKEQGYEQVSTIADYHAKYVTLWDSWWKGFEPSFHDYKVTNVRKTITKVKRKSLKMAKTVSEDWANMLLNDKTYIIIDDEQGQSFVSGTEEEQQGGVLGQSKFWKYGNKTIEKAYATGTCAFLLQLVAPKVKDGRLIADNVKIRCIRDTQQIIPLSWEENEVIDCAFYSESVVEGKMYLTLQKMLKQVDGRYLVVNQFYFKKNNEYIETVSPDGVVSSYYLPCMPFFIVTPMFENNVDTVPLGMSCYANAIDQLMGCDIAYDNIYNDFILGRKKVHVSQDAIATEYVLIKDSNGEMVSREVPSIGDTLEQSLYYNLGERLPDQEILFKEYNPTIRVDENEKGIQLFLNLLSSKVGFGNHRYRFDRITMATATEVKSNNKDLVESVWKQRIMIQDVLISMTKAILIFGKELCNQNINIDAKISIQFDETMFTDEETERMRFIQEIREGIRQSWEYRVKYLGEDEKTAKSMVDDTTGIEGNYS